MPFTEEQEKAILDFVTKASAAPQAPAKPAGEDEAAKTIAQKAKEDLEAEKAKSIIDQAKDAVASQKAVGESLAKSEESIKFNLSVTDFVKKNETLLPEEAGAILATISSKKFNDESEKANTTRKNLLDSFLALKDNIDVMTASMQTRAAFYKSLAESDKEKRSSEFWDLAEVGIALKQGARKAEALKKINGGNTGEPSGNPLEDKILAAANKKFNINQEKK